jgi:hypothetical protein
MWDREKFTLKNYFIVLLVGFVVWILITIGIWFGSKTLGLGDDIWSIIESLSTAITAAAILGAGLVAYHELREANRSRYLSIMEGLFQELNSKEHIVARKWIYLELPDRIEEINSLDDEKKYNIKLALNSLDKVAFITQSGWIPVETIMEWINPMVVKLWEKLGPIVMAERDVRSEPDYYKNAEIFANQCIAWRSEHYKGKQYNWVKREDIS